MPRNMMFIVRALSIRARPVTREALSRWDVGDDVDFFVQQRGDRYLRLRYVAEDDFVHRRPVIAMQRN